MKVGICFKTPCLYKNESETAICSRIDCPLMEKISEKPKLELPDVPRRGMESTGSSRQGTETGTEEIPKCQEG